MACSPSGHCNWILTQGVSFAFTHLPFMDSSKKLTMLQLPKHLVVNRIYASLGNEKPVRYRHVESSPSNPWWARPCRNGWRETHHQCLPSHNLFLPMCCVLERWIRKALVWVEFLHWVWFWVLLSATLGQGRAKLTGMTHCIGRVVHRPSRLPGKGRPLLCSIVFLNAFLKHSKRKHGCLASSHPGHLVLPVLRMHKFGSAQASRAQGSSYFCLGFRLNGCLLQ